MLSLQPSFKPLLLKGEGPVNLLEEVNVNSKEENYFKTVVPIVSKNLASVHDRLSDHRDLAHSYTNLENHVQNQMRPTRDLVCVLHARGGTPRGSPFSKSPELRLTLRLTLFTHAKGLSQ
jgi:hypothetical protein